MKQTKEQLITEVEKLKIQLDSNDNQDSHLRTQISNMLRGGGKENFAPYSRNMDFIFTWLEITCEIEKLLEKAKEFDQTQEIKHVEDQLQFIYEKIQKQEEKNENRN